MSFTVVLYNSRYCKATHNIVAGIFIGARFAGITELPIAREKDGKYTILQRHLPKGRYYLLEAAAEDIDTLMVYKNTIILTNERHSLIASFNSDEVLVGVSIFFSFYGRYPIDLRFKINGVDNYILPVDYSNLYVGDTKDIILPKTVTIRSEDEEEIFVSEDNGWRRKDFIEVITKRFTTPYRLRAIGVQGLFEVS